MTDNNGYKKRIRTRMALTGESFSVARNKVSYVQGDIPSLENLFEADDFRTLHNFYEDKNNSMLVVAGNIGAGKSTTLASIGKYSPTTNRVITIEKEGTILSNLTQQSVSIKAKVNPKEGEIRPTYVPISDLISASIRMRPDVLVVDELRESADYLNFVEASALGTKVLTTYHSQPLSISYTIRKILLNIPPEYDEKKALSKLGVVVQQTILRDGKNKFILNAALPWSQEMRELATFDTPDEEYENWFRSIGVETLQSKIDKLVANKVLNGIVQGYKIA